MDSKKQFSVMVGLNDQMVNWMPPWSIWSDSDLNAERWEPGKGKHLRIGSQEQTNTVFVDPLGHCAVPASVFSQVDSFEEIRLEQIIVPKETEAGLPVEYNGPSTALRSIAEAITFLLKINSTQPIPIIELLGSDYTPQSSWKPWHHVYSSCKAGKNITHKPTTNNLGKYFVRLFYLGNWRKIPIDSWLPVDADRKWLLPTCGQYLWPQLLTKALLKIGALTWTAEDELAGWNPVECLTGWCPLSINCEKMAPIKLWKLFLKLLSKSNDVLDYHPELLVDDLKLFDDGLSLYGYSNQQASTEEAFKQLNPKDEQLGPVSVLADLDVGTILLLNVDITMDPFAEFPRPQTPQWKRFRWKEWATARGIKFERSLPTIRSVKIYTPNVRPIPEEFVNEIEEHSVKVKGKEKPKKVVQVPGNEMFAKFDALCCYINRLHIFLRPSSFVQCMFINNLSSVLSQGDEDYNLPTHRGSHKFSTHSSLNTMQTFTRERISSSFFILCDSDCCKKMFLSLSYLSDITRQKCEHYYQLGGNDEEQWDDNVSPMVSILAEPYDWKLESSTEPIHLELKPTVLSMGAGITVFQLWFGHPPNQISLMLSSQTPFVVGSREAILEKMSEGSISLRQYATELSKSINVLCSKTPFTHAHQDALEIFHLSYLPPSFRDLEKPLKDPFAKLLKSRLPKVLVAAARVFGQDDILKQVSFLVECDCIITDVLIRLHHLTPEQRSKLEDEQITIGKPKVNEAMRSSLFDSKRKKSKMDIPRKSILLPQFFEDLHLGIFFLKYMLMKDNISLVRYPFRNDFNSLVYFNEYKGAHKIDPLQKWIPLFQLTLNHCRCLETRTLCAVQMTTTAHLWELKIIDDRTGNILPNVLREPLPFYFVKGNTYTVLGYCWVGQDVMREIPWTLRILGAGVESVPHSCGSYEGGECQPLQPKMLAVQELVDYYLPNKYNVACKTLIKYKSSITFTLRFAIMSKETKFVLKLIKDEKELHEFRGVGDLVVPTITLEHCGRERVEEFCAVEVTIVDGWRLNRSQMESIPAVLQRARRRRLVFQGVFESNDMISASTSSLMAGSRRRSMAGMRNRPPGALFSLKHPRDYIPNAPTCSISVAFEPVNANIISVVVDERALEELRSSKINREMRFPGRHDKGVQLREEFINRLRPKSANSLAATLDFDAFDISILEERESDSRSVEEIFVDKHQTKSYFARMKEQEFSSAKIGNYINSVVEDGLNETQNAYDITQSALNNEIEECTEYLAILLVLMFFNVFRPCRALK